jgi:AcrR family transcriptional regulator
MPDQTKPAVDAAAARTALPAHQERSRDTRDRLLAAAELAFATRGYEGSRIADIAQVAGVSAGAVYFRFRDKEALFGGIVERFAEDAQRRGAGFSDGLAADDWKAIVRRLVHGTWELFSNHRGLFRVVMERGVQAPQAFLPIVAVRLEIGRLLAAAVARTVDAARRDLKVQVAMQLIFGFVLNSLSSPVSPTREHGIAAIEELASAVIAYLEHTT